MINIYTYIFIKKIIILVNKELFFLTIPRFRDFLMQYLNIFTVNEHPHNDYLLIVWYYGNVHIYNVYMYI